MASLSLTRSRQAPAEESPAFGGIAERFRRGGDLDRAIVLCREGLLKFPNQLSARVTLGWALLDKGDYEAARAELEQVLRRAPDNLAAIRGLAELHERAEMAMPGMDGDTHWAPPADPPEVADLPPVPLPAHVSVEADLAVPVDAQGNPLVVSSSTPIEVDAFHVVPSEALEPQPSAFAVDAAEAVSTDIDLAAFDVAADEPLAESPAFLAGDESDDLAALAALAFDVGIEPADDRALFSAPEADEAETPIYAAQPSHGSFQGALLDAGAILAQFDETRPAPVAAEDADSLATQSHQALDQSFPASTEAAFDVADAEVADLLLDLPGASADLVLTDAFAALEAGSRGDLDDEPVVDLAAAAEDPAPSTELVWPPLPIGQLEFVAPVWVDDAAPIDDAEIAVDASEEAAEGAGGAIAAALDSAEIVTPQPEEVGRLEATVEAVDRALIDDTPTANEGTVLPEETLPVAALTTPTVGHIPQTTTSLHIGAVEIERSSASAETPTMGAHAASRRSALPALERFLRQVQARRLQLETGSPA